MIRKSDLRLLKSVKFLIFLALIFFTFAIIFPRFPLSSAAYSAEAIRLSNDEAQKIYGDSSRHFEAARRSLRLQTETPDVETPRAEDRKFFDFNFSIRGLENLPRLILFISIASIIAVVLYNLKDNLWSRSRARRLEFESGEKGPAAAMRMETASAEADDLAGAGSFAEAIHVLLLRSVSEMRRRLNNPIAESLTSREILRITGLSPEMRDSFAAIVGSVEISRFGSHQPGEEEYAKCRGNFDALAELLRQGRR